MVVRGSGRMKLDDEIVELKEWDAVRVPPGTWRGYEAGTEGQTSSSARRISATLRVTTSRAGATGGPTSARCTSQTKVGFLTMRPVFGRFFRDPLRFVLAGPCAIARVGAALP